MNKMLLLIALGGATMVSPLVIAGPFVDVEPERNTFEAIDELRKEGWVVGRSTAPAMFFPDAAITRAEIAVLIVRAKHGVNTLPASPAGTIPDVPTAFWGAAWVEYAVNDGLMDLIDGDFYPDVGATRADVASLMWLLMEE